MSIRHTVTGDSDDHLAALTILLLVVVFLCQRNIIHTIHYPLYAEIINLHFHVWRIEWLSQLGEWVRTYYLVASSLRIFEWKFLLSLLRHLYSLFHYSTRFSAKYSIIYSSNRLKYSDACTNFTHQHDLPAAVRYLIFRVLLRGEGFPKWRVLLAWVWFVLATSIRMMLHLRTVDFPFLYSRCHRPWLIHTSMGMISPVNLTQYI